MKICTMLAVVALCGGAIAGAQGRKNPALAVPMPSSEAKSAADSAALKIHPNEFRDITYLSVSGPNGTTVDDKLDVYQHPDTAKPHGVVIYIHGGGWAKGERPKSYSNFRSFLAMGYSGISIEYRFSDVAIAPAGVQDARCALSWVKKNAAKYNFDPNRVVVYGTSAGGHLALMAGLPPQPAPYDLPSCTDQPKVAAVLDFYGITDVADLLDGVNKRGWANRWIPEGTENREALARAMSPLTYVRKGIPPVFIVQGDKDPTVPYSQSVRLEKALTDVGVAHDFYTVPDGVHGKFPDDQKTVIDERIRAFFQAQKLIP